MSSRTYLQIINCKTHHFYLLTTIYIDKFAINILEYRPVASGGAGGACTPHFLADQLTLSQPGGGHIIPTKYYVPPPRIFRPCDGPAHDKIFVYNFCIL